MILDTIRCKDAGTLPALFEERCRRSPDAEAYRYWDPVMARWESLRWREMRRVWLTLESWTVDDGLLTPTLKLRRKPLEERRWTFLSHLAQHSWSCLRSGCLDRWRRDRP